MEIISTNASQLLANGPLDLNINTTANYSNILGHVNGSSSSTTENPLELLHVSENNDHNFTSLSQEENYKFPHGDSSYSEFSGSRFAWLILHISSGGIFAIFLFLTLILIFYLLRHYPAVAKKTGAGQCQNTRKITTETFTEEQSRLSSWYSNWIYTRKWGKIRGGRCRIVQEKREGVETAPELECLNDWDKGTVQIDLDD